MNYVDDHLRAAPREAAPRSDLWLGIAPRLHASRWSSAFRIAAALVLFAAGTVTGIAIERSDGGAERASPSLSAFQAAIAVQESGSAYLAALGRLRDADSRDPLARNQGYEAALVVLAAAAEEVVSAARLPGGTLTGEARRARRVMAERVPAGDGGRQ